MGFIIALCIFLILFNILMWVYFLRKFNTFFSTDEIINETNERVQGIIRDINRAVSRDIELTDERVQELRRAASEAERRVALLQRELGASAKSRRFQQRLAAREREKGAQGSLFEEGEGAGEGDVPDGFTLTVAEKPVVPKRPFGEVVKELSARGLTPEEIARKTGHPELEITLILDQLS